MTREDANFILANIDRRVCDAELSEALDMAIEALSAEPCEDAISRQAVLSMQYRIDDSATLSTRDVVDVDDIEDLPPVTPIQNMGRWIPIKTRPLSDKEKEEYADLGYSEDSISFMYDCPLPDDGQEVLVTTRYDEVKTDTFYRDEGCYFETYCDEDDVKAWMPLPVPMIPEPYREESDIHCNCTDAEIAKSFIEDVEAVKELLPRAEREVSE